jgi:hypothetical protein
MPTGRTRLLSLVVIVTTLVCAGAADAGVPKRFMFPVVGKVTYTNDYGDARSQGSHQGNDLMGSRYQYAIAAEAGRVQKWTSSSSAGCMLYLYGKSGTTYMYIHLNNDRPGGRLNDNSGGCKGGIAWPRSLRNGQRVRAGQLIGFVGDSGDANGIQPHLHFEVHPNGGGAVNPYRHLSRARRLLYAAPPSTGPINLRLKGVVRQHSERLNVRTAVVRSSTGKKFRVTKYVRLDLPGNVLVERQTARGDHEPSSLSAVAPGDRVIVWTNRERPSLVNQRALPGSWAAKRVRIVH